MQRMISMCKTYRGDKKKICDYLKKKKVAKTSDIVFDLRLDARKVWQITNELEKDGIVFTNL